MAWPWAWQVLLTATVLLSYLQIQSKSVPAHNFDRRQIRIGLGWIER
jgi:hypothetical protein